MRIYTAPLLDNETGEVFVRSEGTQGSDGISFHCDLESRPSTSDLVVIDLVHQAYNIYLHRVSVGSSTTMMKDQISNFATSLKSFVVDLPVPPVVIWATFVAAAESKMREDRLFFEQYISDCYRDDDCGNLHPVIEWLKAIWARTEQVTWPLILPDFDLFITTAR